MWKWFAAAAVLACAGVAGWFYARSVRGREPTRAAVGASDAAVGTGAAGSVGPRMSSADLVVASVRGIAAEEDRGAWLAEASAGEIVEQMFGSIGHLTPVLERLSELPRDEVESALIAACRDPRFREPSKHVSRGYDVIYMIGHLRVTPAAAELVDAARNGPPTLREDAIVGLAMLGVDAGADVVVGALGGERNEASAAQRGLKWRGEKDPPEPGFAEAVFAALVTRLGEATGAFSETDVPALLVSLDAPRAFEVLTSPEMLRVDHPLLPDILDAVAVPAGGGAAIRALVAELDATPTEGPRWAQGAAIAALARLGHRDAEGLARGAVESDDRGLQFGGARALATLRGITSDPIDFVQARSALEHASLTPPQRAVLATSAYVAEVNNGGHEQYFFNSAGDDSHQAVEALELLRANDLAAILRDAIAVFGAAGPPRNRLARIDRLNELTSADSELFDALDDRLYASPNDLDTLVLILAAAHAADFRE